jgi:hypothetical protein
MAVTNEQVQAVVDTTRDTTPFIATAALVVTEDLQDKGLSPERLDLITLYLAAHFTALTDERGAIQQERIGEAQEMYKIPTDKSEGLAFTRFGQQAMILDTSGTLAGMASSKGLRARFEVLEQPDHESF